MGRVFLGRSGGGRLLAIKVIRAELAEDADFRARFGREVDAAKKVSGLFTAPVVDADVDAPLPWLATAYVPGPSLAEAITSHGPFPAPSVLALAAGLAEGLSAIHAAGLVHRDLKPSNVLLADDGPRVIDFGISRAAEASALTGTGLVVGSPGFMSPEQADGGEVGPPSDVFSLGAVLTFAGTGQGPFGTGSTAALLYRVVHNPPATGNLPEPVRLLAERCMHKDPQQRPTSAQLLTELEAAQPIEGWLPQPITELLRPYQVAGSGHTATGTPPGTPARPATEPVIHRTPASPPNISGESSTVTAAGARAPDQSAAQTPESAPNPVTGEEHAIPPRNRKRPRKPMITVIALLVLVAIAVVLVLTLPGKPTSIRQPAAASVVHTDRISVPAAQPWTDTHIYLPENSHIALVATGIINVYGGRADSYKTPDGGPACIASPTAFGGRWTAMGLPCWSLVGRVGDGKPFEVGSTFADHSVDGSGELYLGVNDETGSFGDDSGSWSVEIVWYTKQP
jgi:serine/threonine protein kinase